MHARTSCPALRQSSRRCLTVVTHSSASSCRRWNCAYGRQAVSAVAGACPGWSWSHHQRQAAQEPQCRRVRGYGPAHALDNDSAPGAPASPDQELWSAGELYREGAERLRAFMEVVPELAEHEAVLGSLLGSNPALVVADPLEVRAQLEALAEALGVSLLRVARLASRVPAVWERPAGEAAAKAAAMASELGVGMEAALDLYGSQPGIWAVNHPSIIKDRLDVLATKLGLPLPDLVALVGRQALLWVVPPSQVACTLGDVAGALGLSGEQATELMARVPPIVTIEKRLMRLSVQGVSSTTGVPVSALLELLSRSLGLVAVPTELLAASLERLAADLDVRPEDVVALMTKQPTLLCSQYGTIQGALATLEAGLAVDRAGALAVLAAQPCLMYDTTADTVASRVEALADTFGLGGPAEARALAAAQPALLVVAPATVRSAVSLVGAQTGASLAEVLELARSDPGSFVLATLQESLLDAWSARLELPVESVSAMLSAQPALLELTPTTVKARLESLAALFGVPAGLAAQLALKHAALAAVPPNATITRAKNISMALRISMQGAASIIAKEPAMLAVLAYGAAELRGSGVADDVGEVGAAYEFYTMDWLQRQLKEMQPSRVTSFANLDS
ncbi:hypothetical protein PLESTB_001126300 [Pleodorina starrii]|uniref:Uncharacterized protein n=1 Tax=Pleodorina starrii TaxID=330485 RepID=A0A9W6F4V8_9CHLO|nr:hypothetical protein PLESTM_001363900 [Pleodorina starrii]GLC56608.1 hypothetical protein PLESTB_001126300 [Pleodorina starrii]GLC76196.1 hypothetical protein PLESTF_001748500 [Pleodorina starrii]